MPTPEREPYLWLVNFSQPQTIASGGRLYRAAAVIAELGKLFPVSGRELKVHSILSDIGLVPLDPPVEILVAPSTIAGTQRFREG